MKTKYDKYLKKAITADMTLSQLVDVFEDMCRLPAPSDEDSLLFETGVYSFTGETLFYFSLVRQLGGVKDKDEYLQIHLDIMFKTDEKNRGFDDPEWYEPIDEKAFEDIKNSEAFCYLSNSEIYKINIYAEET